MPLSEARDEPALLAAAQAGDEVAFERLTAGYRKELTAYCYRMLGSPHDAEDALQESLLGAWRGLAAFEGRSSLRTWLYRIATNVCLRLGARRPRRIQSPDYGPSWRDTAELGEPVISRAWLEPWPDEPPASEPDPAASYLRRESVELAFVAALQHLPANQRAVLILRDVLEYSAAKTAEMLDTSAVSVNSALVRARKTVSDRIPSATQRAELAAIGPEGQRELVDAFVAAWERSDVDTLVALLAEDAKFTMPPLPAWFDGRENVARFLRERVFATPWRLRPVWANGQVAFACYQGNPDGVFRLAAISLLGLRSGRIVEIASFLDPSVHQLFDQASELSEETSENLLSER